MKKIKIRVENRSNIEFVERFFNGIHILCGTPFDDDDFQEILDEVKRHEFTWNESISDEKLTRIFIEYAKERLWI